MILLMTAGLKGTASLLAASVATCNPVQTALFTPIHPDFGRYEVCTTEEAIGRLVPSAARIEALEALDAFGTAGPYDRAALARLYGGRRARVARAWTVNGTDFESTTYVSPYPDVTLTRLMPGTMIIRFRTSRGARGPRS